MLSHANPNKHTNKRNPKKNLPETPDVSTHDIAAWMRFVNAIQVPNLFSQLQDTRQRSKVKYSLTSLLLWAFSACAFRLGSKNAFQTSLEDLHSTQRQGLLHLLHLEENDLPHSSTVDNLLSLIPSMGAKVRWIFIKMGLVRFDRKNFRTLN